MNKKAHKNSALTKENPFPEQDFEKLIKHIEQSLQVHHFVYFKFIEH